MCVVRRSRQPDRSAPANTRTPAPSAGHAPAPAAATTAPPPPTAATAPAATSRTAGHPSPAATASPPLAPAAAAPPAAPAAAAATRATDPRGVEHHRLGEDDERLDAFEGSEFYGRICGTRVVHEIVSSKRNISYVLTIQDGPFSCDFFLACSAECTSLFS